MIESFPNNYQNKGMTDSTILQSKRGLDPAHQIEEKINKIKTIISKWRKLRPMNFGKKQKKKKPKKLEWPMNYKSPKMNNQKKNSSNHLPFRLLHHNNHKIFVNAIQLPSFSIANGTAMVPQQSFPSMAPETIEPMGLGSSAASSEPASFELVSSELAASSLQTLGWRIWKELLVSGDQVKNLTLQRHYRVYVES